MKHNRDRNIYASQLTIMRTWETYFFMGLLVINVLLGMVSVHWGMIREWGDVIVLKFAKNLRKSLNAQIRKALQECCGSLGHSGSASLILEFLDKISVLFFAHLHLLLEHRVDELKTLNIVRFSSTSRFFTRNWNNRTKKYLDSIKKLPWYCAPLPSYKKRIPRLSGPVK